MVSLRTKREKISPPKVVAQRKRKVPAMPTDLDMSMKGVIMVMTSIQNQWEIVAKDMPAS